MARAARETMLVRLAMVFSLLLPKIHAEIMSTASASGICEAPYISSVNESP